jgi:Uma2 family endonuclease
MAVEAPASVEAPQLDAIPPLRHGDRMTAREFERRYRAMPHVKKAELIEGVVLMASPVRARMHSTPQSWLNGWLFVYRAHTPGVESGDHGTVRMDGRNVPQPDGLLYILREYGGQSSISRDDYLEGAPELVAEVAASSQGFDSGTKLAMYQRNGVREYLLYRSEESEVLWYELRAGRYEPIQPDSDGILRSRVFPGLWLDASALLSGDAPRMLEVLQQGLASPEHAAFAAALGRRRER